MLCSILLLDYIITVFVHYIIYLWVFQFSVIRNNASKNILAHVI
jgi:hypothetical protein